MLSEIITSFLTYILSGCIIVGAASRELMALASSSHLTLGMGLLIVDFKLVPQESLELRFIDVAG